MELISSKFENFQDFDIVGTMPHVLYADSLCAHSIDDLWDVYSSIRIFHALSVDLYDEWRWLGGAATEGELKHAIEYQKKITNTKLLCHLNLAIETYMDKYKNIPNQNLDWSRIWHFQDENYFWKKLPDDGFIYLRIGIYVRALDAYGIFEISDTGNVSRKKYYISDEAFSKKSYVDVLMCRFCAIDDNPKSRETIRTN